MDLQKQMAADAGGKVSDESLGKISKLAEEQLKLEEQVISLEKLLKETKTKLRGVSEGELPDAMSEVGMSEFKLTDGTKISVKRTFVGTVTEKNKPKAHEWLRENGHGDLIKHTVNASFARGQEESAAAVTKVLKELGTKFTSKEAVHPQTLQAFIREQMVESPDFPQDLFNVFPVQKSTVGK